MSERPILFLDVDGVLAVYGLKAEGEPLLVDRANVDFPVTVAYGLAPRVQRLSEAFEVVWSTAWFGAAHGAFRRHLGLPSESWPYLPWNQHKLTEIVKRAGERSWAWVDDDAHYELRDLGWEAGRHFDGLIVQPDPSIGLTDAHVDELLAFAASCPSVHGTGKET